MTEEYNNIKNEDIETELGIVNESFAEYESEGTSALNSNGFGNNTIEDYLKLPEGTRVELIDGVFYDMAAPTMAHQKIITAVANVLESYIDSNNGKCVSFVGPTDVQLDKDDKTMVQPDIMVTCDRTKFTKARLVGAPDFVIEVLSPSNWYNDTTRKFLKYKNAGVREYWIIMPENRKVLVYYFAKSDLPTEYTFSDEIPVNIWEGKCKIDFKKIYDKISFML